MDFIFSFFFFLRVETERAKKRNSGSLVYIIFFFRLLRAPPSHPRGFGRIRIYKKNPHTQVYGRRALVPTGKQYISRYINRAADPRAGRNEREEGKISRRHCCHGNAKAKVEKYVDATASVRRSSTGK